MSEPRAIPKLWLFVPAPDTLRLLWEKFQSAKEKFGDEFCPDEFDFVAWISTRDSVAFTLGETSESLDGMVLFTGIVEGDACFAHIFLWDTAKYEYGEIVKSLRALALAQMRHFKLRRIATLTPESNRPALHFARIVGFKRIEKGIIRAACKVAGEVQNGILQDLTEEDVIGAGKPDTMGGGDAVS